MRQCLMVCFLVLVVLVLTGGRLATDSGAPQVILETDADGNPVQGSVAALLQHVNAGGDFRVGWELKFGPDRMTHWSDSGFVTVWKGHVFAQLPSIDAQGPIMDRPGIVLPNQGPPNWTGVLGSNATLHSRFSGEKADTQRVRTWWVIRDGS